MTSPHWSKYANNINVMEYSPGPFPHPYTKKDAQEWIILNELIYPATNFAIRLDGNTLVVPG